MHVGIMMTHHVGLMLDSLIDQAHCETRWQPPCSTRHSVPGTPNFYAALSTALHTSYYLMQMVCSINSHCWTEASAEIIFYLTDSVE